MMTPRERLLATLNFQRPDRIALLGGWVIDDGHQQAIACCTEEAYWENPARWAIEAHRALGCDSMIAIITPPSPGDYRQGLTKAEFEGYKDKYPTLEHVVAYVRSQPSPEVAAKNFDADAWRDKLVSGIVNAQRWLGDMVYLPTLWEEVHPRFEWYPEFGYEHYLVLLHRYPELANRFFESLAAVSRKKSEIVVEVYHALDLVPMTLIGTDICGGGGPVVSPKLLRECYFPHVRSSLAPLRDAGIKTVWHSDGDFRPLVDDILACGVSGFQGFQEEFGVDIADLARHRTADGERLVLWAGPSVSAVLAFGTPDEVCRDVRRIIETLADECALFILPANNFLPGSPVENVLTMYRCAATARPRATTEDGGYRS